MIAILGMEQDAEQPLQRCERRASQGSTNWQTINSPPCQSQQLIRGNGGGHHLQKGIIMQLTPLMLLSKQVRENAERVAQAIQAARPAYAKELEAIAKQNNCTAEIVTEQQLAESGDE